MAKNKQNEQADEEVKAANELLEDQIWEEAQDENPFKRPLQAQILEVRKNESGAVWVKFQPVYPARLDVKDPIGYVVEGEFRTKFPKKVK